MFAFSPGNVLVVGKRWGQIGGTCTCVIEGCVGFVSILLFVSFVKMWFGVGLVCLCFVLYMYGLLEKLEDGVKSEVHLPVCDTDV